MALDYSGKNLPDVDSLRGTPKEIQETGQGEGRNFNLLACTTKVNIKHRTISTQSNINPLFDAVDNPAPVSSFIISVINKNLQSVPRRKKKNAF